jgi:chemotaxis protein MotB
MARRVFPLFVIGLGFLTGCVPNDKYQALKLENEQNRETARIAALQSATAKAEAEALRDQKQGLIDQLTELRNKNDSLAAELGILKEQNGQLSEAYKNAMSKPSGDISIVQANALNDEQDRILREFAAKYPDLLEYDPVRGMVKFKSDVTFASGSDVLNDRAKTAIKEFSALLKQPAFNTCDFFVAGHTDNVPVSNPTTLKNHPDNWYLSAHRAISVAHDLITNGVTQTRLGVEGFSDNRPVADNKTADGRQKNRRVEVAILPRKGNSGIQAASNESTTKTTTTSIKPAVGNKDDKPVSGTRIIAPPVMNKN